MKGRVWRMARKSGGRGVKKEDGRGERLECLNDKSKILRTFVRNTYRWHLSEILATIVNEYTDWERPVQHPINIRDETLEALSDASVVAPAVRTADLHSAQRRNSFLYVFDYQTKFGDYPQRQGCIHGEELPYVLGAPLVGGLAHFPRNYTKAEVLLAEATMIYWSNFARTGLVFIKAAISLKMKKKLIHS
ncbi:Neuroligin-1 [Gryllus bimaculatus]|nr:Neuroligin-1 [Gryllus bimaculatus]